MATILDVKAAVSAAVTTLGTLTQQVTALTPQVAALVNNTSLPSVLQSQIDDVANASGQLTSGAAALGAALHGLAQALTPTPPAAAPKK